MADNKEKTALEKSLDEIAVADTYEEYEVNDQGDDVLSLRIGYDNMDRTVLEEKYNLEYEVVEETKIHYYDKDNEFQKTKVFNASGDVINMIWSAKEQFMRRWDDTLVVNLYSRKHIQRISMAIRISLGESGRDWEVFMNGFKEAVDILDHNQENPEELVPQRIIFGFKFNNQNDVDSFKMAIKKLNLKFMSKKD